MTVSAWADLYRMLPSESPEPGRYSSERVPYFKEVMRAFTEPDVRRIAVKSASQVGKSEVLLNVVGRTAHLDPCSILIVQPTLSDAEDFSKSRLSKMIADTKVLTPLFYERLKSRDTNQTILSKFYRGGRVLLVGSNSPSGLASRPIKILLCDEVDRYVPTTEGDAIDLAAKRTSNFWDARVALFSTPANKGSSRIDIEYELGTQEEWRHRCPNCLEWHVLNHADMVSDYARRLDEAGNASVIVRSVKWRCPDCGFEHDERTMRRAEQSYFAQNPDALKNGVRSFFVNGFASPWLRWADIMREWLEAQGDPTREAVVWNTRFGLSYELRGQVSDESDLLRRREEYEAELPAQVKLLTAGVDVQGNRLEYLVCGWGNGFEAWLIERGVIKGEPGLASTWRALDDVLDKTYRFADGRGLQIARAFVDSGFGTEAVYAYCKRRPTRYAVKGLGKPGVPLIHQYSYPKGAGVILVVLGVDSGKTEIFSRLSVTEGDGLIHFPKHFDADFFKQLTAERRVVRKIGGLLVESYEKVNREARNEMLDCLVYALAAAKSCVGSSDAKGFWRRLSGIETKKPATRLQSRELDVWG